jgi:hypothetical protein
MGYFLHAKAGQYWTQINKGGFISSRSPNFLATSALFGFVSIVLQQIGAFVGSSLAVIV